MNVLSSREAVLASLQRVAPEIDLETIDPDVELRDELDLDSMGFLTFVDTLHDLTGVDLPERDYPHLQTLEGCTAYVAAHRVEP